MPTTIARAPKDKARIQELRTRAERLMREIKTLEIQLECEVERLNQTGGDASPQPSPLDKVQGLLKVTEDLRVANGKLSATLIANAFGVSVNELAGWLGRSRQALAKTPDADSLQNELGFFERVARLRAVVPHERFLKWLRMPNAQLDGEAPLKLMAQGQQQVVMDYVEDMLTGAPT